MTARRRFNPLPFSPGYEFLATRPFVLEGVEVQAGDQIDKSNLSERRLRQLYENRRISPVAPAFLFNGSNIQAPQIEPAPIDPADTAQPPSGEDGTGEAAADLSPSAAADTDQAQTEASAGEPVEASPLEGEVVVTDAPTPLEAEIEAATPEGETAPVDPAAAVEQAAVAEAEEPTRKRKAAAAK